MSVPFSRPASQAIFDRTRDLVSVNILGGAPVVPETNEWYLTATETALQEEAYSFIAQVLNERDPRYACYENLVKLAAFDGVHPRPASYAQGYVKMTGTAGTTIPAAQEMTFGEATFRVSGSLADAIGADGTATVRVLAVEPGTTGNGVDGDGALVNPPAGIDATVTRRGDTFCGGAEAETCEAFRQRYLDRMAFRPTHRQDAIIAKIMEWPCVTRVCVRGGNCCEVSGCDGCDACGSGLAFYPMMDGAFDCGLPPANVVQEISDWLWGVPQGHGAGQVEAGVCGTLHTATAAMINVAINDETCMTPSQQAEVEKRIAVLFGTFCPSHDVCLEAVRNVVSQVTGQPCDADVTITSSSDGVRADRCGDLLIDCDVLACLGTISWTRDPA